MYNESVQYRPEYSITLNKEVLWGLLSEQKSQCETKNTRIWDKLFSMRVLTIESNGLGSKLSGAHSVVRRTTFMRQSPMSATGLGEGQKGVDNTHDVRDPDHKYRCEPSR
jgi:hypothetical protein